MKKLVCAIAIFAACGSFFAKINESLYKENVIKTEPCEWQKVTVSENIYKYRGEITYDQMKEDLASLKYILETCYSGYEAACQRGLNLDAVIKNIEEKFSGQDYVQSRNLAKAFYEETKKYIVDGHFSIWLGQDSLRFCTHSNVYFSDFYIENDEADLFSSEEGELLPYYKDGKQKLRVGRISEKSVTEVSFNFKGSSKTVPVKLFPCDIPSMKPVLKEKESSNTAYIRLESFMPDGTKASEINFEKWSNAGLRYLNKSNVIVDLRTNNGGFPEYVMKFLAGFVFDYSKIDSTEIYEKCNNSISLKRFEFEDGCYKIISPGILQVHKINIERDKIYKKKYKNYISNITKGDEEYLKLITKWEKTPSKIYTRITLREENLKGLPFPNKPAFNGRMYIILDRNSVSAAEEFVVFAKKFLGEESVTVIGENSFGSIEFAALRDYTLPNSELSFHVASCTYSSVMNRISNWHGEGKGVFPDVWSTDEDLLETLVFVTGDGKLKDVLGDLK